MSIKSDKLLQRVLDLQKFTAERIAQSTTQETVYQTIQQSLKRLETTLKQGKPVVQIVGAELSQVQALRKLLKTNSALETLYQFRVAALPNLADSTASLPALVIETASESGTRYPLSDQPQKIGRHPDAQLRLPDTLTLVSGRHAELRPIDLAQLGQEPLQIGWEICDLNSRNGTYVNGERVRACHPLKSGDFISLGSAAAGPGSIAFRFEQPEPVPAPLNDEVYRSLFDADVLCLVVDPEPSFSLAAQQFLRRSHQTIGKRVVVVAMPGETTELLMSNLNHLANWISDATLIAAPAETTVESIEALAQKTVELVPLLLHSTTTPNATVLSPQAQPGFELFCRDLEILATQHPERLVERTNATFNKQIAQVEQALTVESEGLKQHLLVGEGKTLDVLKEKFQKAIAEVREEKEKVFKQIKQDLSQARAGILDSFSRKSILYQIQAFTDALNPSVLREGSYRRIHLQNGLTGAEVQQEMHNLCRTILVNWSATEWQKVNTGYAGDGLKGLQNRIRTILSQVALLKLEWTQETEPHFDPQRILENSIVEPNFETRYRGDSMKDYFMKQMRAPLMQFTFLSGAVITIGTFLFWLLQSILQGATPAASNTTPVATSSNQSNQYFNAIPTDLKSPMAFIVVFLCISGLMYFFYSLYTNYHREEEFKREDAIAKIKKDLSNYYQSLAKSLVERLSQNLNLLLEAEEQKISKAIDRASDQLKLQALDAKAQLDDYAKQQQKLNEVRLKLEKMKGS